MSDHQSKYPVQGAGLGLRRPIADQLMADPPEDVDFMEVAPENWIHVGGKLGKKLRFFTERYPFLIHGLSLSIGAPSPLNEQLVRDIKDFMAEHKIRLYSEHLSYCGDDGQLYDLMPIPFTEEAVKYVAGRVRRVQDILEQRMALENVSYYAPIHTSMNEREFLLAVIEDADCDLMLDIIDTHGTPVDDQAWALLEEAYSLYGPVPTLLERDFNFPPMDELLDEVRRIKQLQIAAASRMAANG
jgi:uncharacterized protein (UPF0276 family)